MAPIMVDAARHAGVSLKTVSRVVNNAPHVQQELARRAAELLFARIEHPVMTTVTS